jgi:hypothetical protein
MAQVLENLPSKHKAMSSNHSAAKEKQKIKLTLHKVYYFKVYNSVGFSIFTKLCNHRHYLTPEYFNYLKKKSYTYYWLLPNSIPVPGNN